MVAVAFVWKFLYNPQIGCDQSDPGTGYQLADESEDSANRHYGYDDLEGFRLCGRYVYGRPLLLPSDAMEAAKWMARLPGRPSSI